MAENKAVLTRSRKEKGALGRPVDRAADVRIAALWNAGLSVMEIARAEGKTHSAIVRRLNRIERETGK